MPLSVSDDGAMSSILGTLTPAAFLRDHWHKRPLLIRQALPGFGGVVDRDALLALAERPDAISRLVIDHKKGASRWERHDGPFDALAAHMLPASHWTVLVHGVESLVPGGWELLRRFSFIPAARIDDLMVSFATVGGSVGPHDDLYDVFLLQGPGRRRWQVSRGGDRAIDPRASIKVLRSFTPEDEWVLEPGDMLYLPPGVAHHGVAVDDCFTYSIGFLAPSHRDLIHGFLGYLGNAIDPGEHLLDTPLSLQKEPLDVSDALVRDVAKILGGIAWDKSLLDDFVGCFLTRPKPHVQFHPGTLSPEAFARSLRRRGRLSLALPSRGLIRRNRLFLNGEAHAVTRATLALFKELVATRSLTLPLKLDARTIALFHHWHTAGYVA
jgi:50S ribosomal protein L16 3-hydroxylase